MPTRQLHLAAYDVRDPKRLTAALHLVRNHATGGQKSVHEIFLTAQEKYELLHNLSHIITDEDNFILLRLDPRSKVHTRGIAQPPADPDYFYIG